MTLKIKFIDLVLKELVGRMVIQFDRLTGDGNGEKFTHYLALSYKY